MAGRNQIRRWRLVADIGVVALLTLLNPFVSPHKLTPCIPDKVEVRVYRHAAIDSVVFNGQFKELQYYLRTHQVIDEGYNQIAQYNSALVRSSRKDSLPTRTETVRIAAKDRLLPAVKTAGGYWKSGHFHMGKVNGRGMVRDWQGNIVCGIFANDTIVTGIRTDSLGTYRGQMDQWLQACGEGTYDGYDGTHYDGFWQDNRRHGFGIEITASYPVRVGQWKADKFLGERLRYTSERIYGIDISRHQHEKGRKRYGIDWRKVRITSLGHKHPTEGQTFPVSFVYIKSTEGTSIRNRYFLSDYQQAKRQGLRVGAYHFFSIRTPATAQANYFTTHTLFRKGDFPPVLDVEPTHDQVQQIGGAEELLRRIRTFLNIVERRTGMRPILYVNQMFVNRYMQHAEDIKKNYNVWIARYGEYKPDVKLAFWQLSADGRVNGIQGAVDINVFNGYQNQWNEFLSTGIHK